MCGIAGIIDVERSYDANDVNSMLEELDHRGPDNKALVILSTQNNLPFLSLGHARLSIIDLTEAGNQPMESQSGRFVIVFNGEIYNHGILRGLLKTAWQGHSDTETILSCLENFGLKDTLNLLEGMFAFAVYDKLEDSLYLVRDRFGEKPLFYYYNTKVLLFASELKAILKIVKNRLDLASNSIEEFLSIGYIKAPSTIFKNVFKLEPGNVLKIKIDSFGHIKTEEFTYYNRRSVLNQKIAESKKYSFTEAKSLLKEKLEEVVKRTLISDVPIGAFLSGGIDSSLIVAIMRHVSSQKINTYTIGFKERAYDESDIAKETANYLGVESNVHFIGIDEYSSALKQMPYIFDDPMADSSQFPTQLLCRHASSEVTVSLSGDGADEVFGGYNHYQFIPKIYNSILYRSSIARLLISRGAYGVNILNRLFAGKNDKWLAYTEKLNKINQSFKAKNFENFYNAIISGDVTSYINSPNAHHLNHPLLSSEEDIFHTLSMHDIIYYMPDDVLCKVDRMAMSNSLETRAPFLNHDIVEFGCSLPYDFKIKNNKSKFILRELLKDYVPKHITEKPKKGFSIPIDKLMRNYFNNEIEYYLSENLVREYNILDFHKVNLIRDQHLSRQRNLGTILYRLLFLQMWYTKWKDKINR
jgi:asparagine synthase (glutamine-hydrolysing)